VLTSTEVRDAVERAERRFVEACLSATDEQWLFQPRAGERSWNMPQIVEHVATANRNMLPALRDRLVTSPRGHRNLDFEDEDMPYIFYGGGGTPPAGLEEPSGEQSNKAEGVAAFQASVRAILDWYDCVNVDLRDCALAHPAFGLFDGAQWMLFVAVHIQQHRGQVLDVKLASDAVTAWH
jgi:DinB superfamily